MYSKTTYLIDYWKEFNLLDLQHKEVAERNKRNYIKRLASIWLGKEKTMPKHELTWFLVPLQKRGFLIIFYLKGVLNMAKGQRLKPEQIVTLLRQIDVLTTNGKTLAQACKEVGTVEQSYYRWRKIYGGMKVDQAKKYKELEQENTRLKKLVADLSLREVMLKEVIKGNF